MQKKIIRDDTDFVLSRVVKAMQDKKAKKIISLDLSEIPNSVTQYYVICHAGSKQQLGAIYDNVVEEVQKNCGVKPFHREGIENSEWILIDYFDIVVHVFLEDIRAFYHLEDLWADAALKEYASDD
ncbi:MAG: ribosome silencing factor [Bacteroidales bacterium]|nr:ribosome silencing factor [Bacteroidales bacterium]MCF6342382.1 ribosome silencing factor [Bacteroidales bacterium]